MQFYAKLLEKFLEPYLTYLGKLLYKENVVMIIKYTRPRPEKGLTATAKVAKVLGSIPASSDTVESEGRQMKQFRIMYIKNQKPQFLSYTVNLSHVRIE
jgi:hypothetical protein